MQCYSAKTSRPTLHNHLKQEMDDKKHSIIFLSICQCIMLLIRFLQYSVRWVSSSLLVNVIKSEFWKSLCCVFVV